MQKIFIGKSEIEKEYCSCETNPNCYYKQLKRKERECEKAKNIIKEALSDFCGEYGTKEYIKLTKEAKELGIEVIDYE